MASFNSALILFLSIFLLANGQEKLTKLHFYMHETVGVTNIVVAQPLSGTLPPTLFGLMASLDNPLRTEPNNQSEIVGQMQGVITWSSLEEVSIHMSVDLVFTSGEYNGSTLSVMGHNPYFNEIRRVSIVGGTGEFQLARGLLVIKTVSFDTPPGVNFFELNATVLHRVGPIHSVGSHDSW